MEKNLKQFSPVVALGSPISKGKALTGIPLNVRDLVIEVYSNIQKWNTSHLKGVPIVQSIVDFKTDESDPEELIDLCSSLEKICNEIDEVVDNLQIILDKLEKLESLDKNKTVLFSTWPIQKFVSTVRLVYISYKEEADTKRIVLENIALESGDAAKMVNFTTWVYQPQIPDNLKLKVDLMLSEVGLRKP